MFLKNRTLLAKSQSNFDWRSKYISKAGVLTPLDLARDVLIWLRANAGVTLSGSNVSAWDDQSGNGWNLTTASTNTRPIYHSEDAKFNNHPSIEFTDTNDRRFISKAAKTNGSATGVTMFVVMRQSSVGGSVNYVLDLNGGTGKRFLFGHPGFGGAGGEVSYLDASTGWRATGDAADNNDTAILYSVRAGNGSTSGEVRKNNTVIGSGMSWQNTELSWVSATPIFNAANVGNFHVAEAVIYDYRASDTEMTEQWEYYNSKYELV